jgi:hypothetical protein
MICLNYYVRHVRKWILSTDTILEENWTSKDFIQILFHSIQHIRSELLLLFCRWNVIFCENKLGLYVIYLKLPVVLKSYIDVITSWHNSRMIKVRYLDNWCVHMTQFWKVPNHWLFGSMNNLPLNWIHVCLHHFLLWKLPW